MIEKAKCQCDAGKLIKLIIMIIIIIIKMTAGTVQYKIAYIII